MIKRYLLTHAIKFLATIIFISVSSHTLALSTSATGGDTGNTDIPFWAADSYPPGGEYTGNGSVPALVTDTDHQMADYPIYLSLPDNDPVSSARAFSFDSGSVASSTKPTVTCPGATVDSSGTYSVTITISSGASCALTITSPSSSTIYTATLSRAGNVYSVSAGTVCGGVFTCASDTTPPDTTISGQNPATTPTNSTSMQLTFSGTDNVGVASYECQLDGGSYTTCISPKTYSGLSDGSHTVNIRAKDAAGNVDASPATYTWTVDTTAPSAPSTADMTTGTDSGSSNSDNITNDNTPTFTGTAEAGATVELFYGGTNSLGTTTADGSGNWSITATAIPSGAQSITAKATDAAGNTGTASTALSITIDTSAPAAPSTADMTAGTDSGSSNTDNITNDATPTFSGTAEANSTVQLFYGGTNSLGTVTADGSGNWSITATAIPNGAQSITAKATDAAGNVSVASGALSITIDTTAPTVTITQAVGQNDPTTNTSTVNFTATTSEAVTGFDGSDVTIGGTAGATTATVTGSGPYNIAVTGMTNNGTVTVTIAASKMTDTAGNNNSASTNTGNSVTINAQSLVINEIDYDNVSTDDAEFVEIKNISGSAINLSGYTVEFINDTNNSTYRSVSLPNVSLAASDYYVICGNNSTVANCDLDSVPDTDFIQNGTPDIARIIQGSFVIDTVSYGGTADPAIFVETTGTTATDSNTEAFVSLSRYADGTDTGNNNSDFKLKCMTPGVANSINDSSGCYALSINDPTAVTEGNSGTVTITFTVTLSHAAASNVTVNYATANDTATAGADYTATSGTLTFAAGETSKTIAVTVNGDQVDEGASETFKVNLTSPSNNAQLSTTAGATEGIGTITDDDTAGFTLSKTTASVNESGTTDTFTVVLDSQPTSNVVISVVSGNTGEVTATPPNLTFTSGNWNTAQTVTVTGVDDGSVSDGNKNTAVDLGIVGGSSDDAFDALADKTVTVTTIDNDTPGITVNPTTLTVSEPSGTANFAITLNTQPTSSNNVSVPFTVSGACTTTATSPVTIANASWSTGVTITVTASDDNVINASSRTCTITTNNSTSSDASYNNVNPSDVTVTVTDNDTAGISGAQIGGSINVTEGGASGSYPIALSTQPTGDVQVTVTAGTQTQVSTDGTTFSNSIVLTFTNGNWNTPQTVYVKVIDDTTAGGNHTATITHAITGTVVDSNYPTGLTLGSVTINITDNDQAPSNSGGGSTSSGSVVLPSKMQMGVNISGTGSGRVVSQPSGIDCQKTGGTCQADFSANTQVTLTATADDNSEFSGFGGHDDCGDGSLLLLGSRQCTAFFKEKVVSPPIDDNDNGSNNNGNNNGNSNTSHKMIPVYRLWSYTWKGHFYTTNVAERERTLSHEQEWRDEDVAYYVYDAADHPENTHPVYRFWSYVWQSHFYTMNQAEMEYLVNRFSDQWRYEGIAYYAYIEGEQPTNSIPIYRFYSFVFQSHFYTISKDERDVLLTHPASEWRYEGVAWYVSVP